MAGTGKRIPICGGLNVRGFHSFTTESLKAYNPYPYAACIDSFFESLFLEINLQWPDFKEKGAVSIFFDQKVDAEWQTAISKAFAHFKREDQRLGDYSFVDSKLAPHLPMQAADMLAYRCREMNIAAILEKKKYSITTPFDKALLRNITLSSALKIKQLGF